MEGYLLRSVFSPSFSVCRYDLSIFVFKLKRVDWVGKWVPIFQQTN